MAAIGETSSAPLNHTDVRPVVVRVKRKSSQSPLDAFWLEINERPLKRALLDFEKLSIASSSNKEELKSKKVLVQHVETVGTNEAAVDIVQSFMELKSAEVSGSKTKSEERRQIFKKENENKQGQILSKARQKQENVAKNARFEQIWRSRKAIKEPMHGKLQDMCQFYDIVRIDVEERENETKRQKETLEDNTMLYSYLPLLREFIPSAAEEIESELLDYKVEHDDFVYDYYTVKDELDMTAVDASSPFPLVQVDEEDFCDGPDDSEYGSDDSNAENNPLNDYPDELSEDEAESEDSDNESEEESDGDTSSESEELQRNRMSRDESYLDEDDEFVYKYESEGEDSVYEYKDDDSDCCVEGYSEK